MHPYLIRHGNVICGSIYRCVFLGLSERNSRQLDSGGRWYFEDWGQTHGMALKTHILQIGFGWFYSLGINIEHAYDMTSSFHCQNRLTKKLHKHWTGLEAQIG